MRIRRRAVRWIAAAATSSVVVGVVAVTTAPVASARAASTAASGVSGASGAAGLVPLTPTRVYETRAGQVGHQGSWHRLAPGADVSVDVTSAIGVDPASVAAVSLAVVAAAPSAPGYLTVWPDGPRPVASMLNFPPGRTSAGATLVGVSRAGTVSVHNGSAGSVDLVIDLTGWLPVGAGFTGITPRRVLDTRDERGTVSRSMSRRSLDIVGHLGGVAGHVTAVAVVATAVRPDAAGYLAVFPTGGAAPPTSSVNFAAGQTVANAVVVGLDEHGGLDLLSSVAGVDVVVDVTGYFVDGLSFVGVSPQRLLDTRVGATARPLAPGETTTIDVAADAHLPAGLVGAVAVTLTAASATADGYLTAWPASSSRPSASSLNFTAGSGVVANSIVVGVDDQGRLSLYNSAGSTHVIVDITGWFPQDAAGVVAEGRRMRRYTQGDDHLVVVFCQPTDGRPVFTPAEEDAAMAALGRAGDYYRWISGGQYRPSYTRLGDMPASYLAPGQPDCGAPPIPFGTNGLVELVQPPSAPGAYGVTDPGASCREVTCLRGREYPSNGRRSVLSINALENPVPGGTVWFSVAVHELGHLLDWPHSYWGAVRAGCPSGRRDGVCEYDDPLDVMSHEPMAGDHDEPQATIAFNRYAAGWIAPAAVTRHTGGTATYDLVALGGHAAVGGKELVVVPVPGTAALLTIETRAKAVPWDPSMATYDGRLQREGVVVHRIDQRAEVGCIEVAQYGDDRCAGGSRRQQPAYDTGSYAAPSYVNVLAPGSGSQVIDGVTITVVSGGAGRYQVQVSGTAAFAPIPH